jgi:hypothetical protein
MPFERGAVFDMLAQRDLDVRDAEVGRGEPAREGSCGGADQRVGDQAVFAPPVIW